MSLAVAPVIHRTAPVPEPTRPSPVKVRGFTKAFGDQIVLDGLDLEIAEGELVALLGASGSGKTTLLRPLGGPRSGPGRNRCDTRPARHCASGTAPAALATGRGQCAARLESL
ncbi:ATP-binding cassette domain-containing protein [Caulobacter sp. SL161]|uniref:ATP-binding cassette domain-containing protein n=1 Tax=Caulobacter sp. SL161 TaxID=2995156 RepID=UPI0022767A80|nr:ATP-binding cassette domain-containing protein [Caulobacter sp. SL161]MCY1646610.1 ATP-binding cassette domain-containing protein [Caulobacter sp. SL161]